MVRIQRRALGASLQAPKSRPSWPARWLCASPQPWLMNGGRLWTRLQKWCCGSQPAQSGPSSSSHPTAFLNSFRRAGESWTLDGALSKASSSCLSMTLRQAPLHRLSFHSTADKPDRAYKRATHSGTRTPQSNCPPILNAPMSSQCPGWLTDLSLS